MRKPVFVILLLLVSVFSAFPQYLPISSVKRTNIDRRFPILEEFAGIINPAEAYRLLEERHENPNFRDTFMVLNSCLRSWDYSYDPSSGTKSLFVTLDQYGLNQQYCISSFIMISRPGSPNMLGLTLLSPDIDQLRAFTISSFASMSGNYGQGYTYYDDLIRRSSVFEVLYSMSDNYADFVFEVSDTGSGPQIKFLFFYSTD
ncbi:MAG: hypothetical protein LBH46_01440 [Rickettsiales bacterium]|jgi:hypothetical protein|nr:hypothetical protein [Rickettsiales bacterium]